MRDPGNAEPAVACDRISQLREDDMVPPNGFRYLAGYLDEVVQRALLAEIQALMDAAPLYTPSMPRTGRPLSVRMTNCGALGWVTDKVGGYRYQDTHPQTGRSWPPMPERLLTLWGNLAGAGEYELQEAIDTVFARLNASGEMMRIRKRAVREYDLYVQSRTSGRGNLAANVSALKMPGK